LDSQFALKMERSNGNKQRQKKKNKKSWSEFRAVKNSRLPGRKAIIQVGDKTGDMEIKELSQYFTCSRYVIYQMEPR
jgi:hypothetical protein